MTYIQKPRGAGSHFAPEGIQTVQSWRYEVLATLVYASIRANRSWGSCEEGGGPGLALALMCLC